MTEQEFNKIEFLLVALYGITKFERTQERITEALAILDRNKQLLLHGVSQQRELLLAFLLWRDETWGLREDIEDNKEQIEEYLKANNCG
jgi:hypothetical protein